MSETVSVATLAIAVDTSEVAKVPKVMEAAGTSADKLGERVASLCQSFDKLIEYLRQEQQTAAAAAAAAAALALQQQALGAQTQTTVTASERFINSLRTMVNEAGKTRSELLAMKAAELGVATETKGMIDQLERMSKADKTKQFVDGIRQMANEAGKTRAQLLQMKAAELGVSDETKAMIEQIEHASHSHHELALGTAGTTRELMVLAHEAAMGNFQKLGGSFMVLANQTGLVQVALETLSGALIGFGALIAGIGILFASAWLAGHHEMIAMNNALIVTGNYAAMARSQIESLGHAVADSTALTVGHSRELIMALVSTGQIGGEAIKRIAMMAHNYALATGQDMEKTTEDLTKLFSDPAKGAEELNKSWHLLTEAEKEHILMLERTGEKQKAQVELADKLSERVAGQEKNITFLGKAYSELGKAVSVAWTEMKKFIGGAGNNSGNAEVESYNQQIAAARQYLKTMLEANQTGGMDKAIKGQKDFIAALEHARDLVQKEATDTATAASRAHDIAEKQTEITNKAATRAIQLMREELELAKGAPDSVDKRRRVFELTLQIAEAERNLGKEGRALTMEQITAQGQLDALKLKGTNDDIETRFKLGETTQRQHDKEMSNSRIQGLEDLAWIERKIIALGGLDAKDMAMHKDKLAYIKKEQESERNAQANHEKVQDKQDFDEAIRNIQALGTATDQQLTDAIKLQKEHNAEINKTASQVEALRVKQFDLETAQKQSDADFLRDGLEKWNLDKNSMAVYAMRLYFLDQEIEKRKALRTERKVETDIDAEIEKANRITQALGNAASAARQFGSDMANAFGQVGAALGGIVTAFADYNVQMNKIEQQRKAAVNLTTDESAIIKINAEAKQKGAQAQMKSYADMAGAAKGFFKENTTGYKVMADVEKAYRAMELALGLQTMIKKIFFKETEVAANTALNATKLTGEAAASTASVGLAATESSAWGITAVVKAIASLPFPANLIAGAATLAAIVGLGVAIMGSLGGGSSSVPTAAQRQAAVGTGSVLGDADAKSDSIAKAIGYVGANTSILLTHTAPMLRALQSIDRNIGNLGSVLVRSGAVTAKSNGLPDEMGGAASFASSTIGKLLIGGPITEILDKILGGWIGNTLGKIANSIFGGNQTTLDTGIMADPMSVGALANGGSLNASGYNYIKTDGGWFSSDSYDTKKTPLGAEANQQFTAVITSMTDAVKQAAKLLGVNGDDFTERLNSFVVNIGQISTKGLTTDEIQKELEAAFSKVGDDMARFAVDGLQQFQKAGEGYLETLSRIASDYANVDSILASTGMTFGAVGLSSIAARENLVDLAGGIDKLASKADFFAQNFLTEGERLAPVAKYVTEEMEKLGYSGITTRVQFKDLVLGLDLTTQAGRDQYTALMDLADAFAQVHAATVDLSMTEQQIADQRKTLQDQLDKLVMTSAQLRAKERLTMDASNRALFDEVAARQDIADAYAKESSALQTTIDRLKNFAASLTTFITGLSLGGDSPLTPEQKNDVARSTYQDLLAKAKAGDQVAQSQITGAASAYLNANRTINASSPEYTAVFNQVQQDMRDLLAATGAQQSEAERQLSLMTTLAGAMVNLDQSTKSLTDAIDELRQAIAERPGADQIENLYQTLLNRHSDVSGMDYWTQRYAGGASIDQIASEFKTSPEYQSGGGANEIENLYQTLLGRASDAPGKAFWVNAYNSGETIDQIAAEFKQSPEYLALHGSHAAGLTRVPFDGYRAELHAGEAVVDAPAMAALTRYFGGGGGQGGNTAALVAEIRALRAEVAALRADNDRQSNDIVRGVLVASDTNGKTIAESNEKAARVAEWTNCMAQKAAIK